MFTVAAVAINVVVVVVVGVSVVAVGTGCCVRCDFAIMFCEVVNKNRKADGVGHKLSNVRFLFLQLLLLILLLL